MRSFIILFVVAAFLFIATTTTTAENLNLVHNNNIKKHSHLGVHINDLHPAQNARHRAIRNNLEATFSHLREQFFPLENSGHFNWNHKRDVPEAKHIANFIKHNGGIHQFSSSVNNLNPTSSPSSHNSSGGGGGSFGYNVLDYGCDNTGLKDCSSCFKKAITAASSSSNGRGGGSIVFVPAGSYLFIYEDGKSGGDIGIDIPASVALVGVNQGPFRTSRNGGSTLLIRGGRTKMPKRAFVRMTGVDASIKGLNIIYTDMQPTDKVPLFYPPCIQGQAGAENSLMEDLFLANPFHGIDLSTYPCARAIIRGVYGQPLNIGISISKMYDIDKVILCHFWPFWSSYVPGHPILNYVMQNAITFKFERADWLIVQDVFSWGYHRGMYFGTDTSIPQGAQSCNGEFSLINFDDVNVGIEVQNSQPPGILITDINIANAGNGLEGTKHAVLCNSSAEANTFLSITQMSVWGLFTNSLLWQCGGKVSIDNYNIVNWNKKYPAMHATAGRVSLRGGYFSDTIGTAIKIEKTVDRAIVSDNDLVGNPLICEGSDRMCQNNLP